MAQWTQVGRVVAAIAERPHVVARWFEDNLAQAALDAIEATLAPEPSAAEKRDALREARSQAVRALGAESPLVAEIDAQIEAVRAAR